MPKKSYFLAWTGANDFWELKGFRCDSIQNDKLIFYYQINWIGLSVSAQVKLTMNSGALCHRGISSIQQIIVALVFLWDLLAKYTNIFNTKAKSKVSSFTFCLFACVNTEYSCITSSYNLIYFLYFHATLKRIWIYCEWLLHHKWPIFKKYLYHFELSK